SLAGEIRKPKPSPSSAPRVRRSARSFRFAKTGGRREARTRDLRVANAALSQLSWPPTPGKKRTVIVPCAFCDPQTRTNVIIAGDVSVSAHLGIAIDEYDARIRT